VSTYLFYLLLRYLLVNSSSYIFVLTLVRSGSGWSIVLPVIISHSRLYGCDDNGNVRSAPHAFAKWMGLEIECQLEVVLDQDEGEHESII
jgi:hypothetical protein